MNARTHHYTAQITWEGNRGDGTGTYEGYGREYRVDISGKPSLANSSDTRFRGDSTRHNPEDLFVAAIAGCHLLAYLALCARRGVRVLAYEDAAVGVLAFDGRGGGRFESVTLRPTVVIDDTSDQQLAMSLHQEAHEVCFIAASCSTPIHHEATIGVRSLASVERTSS